MPRKTLLSLAVVIPVMGMSGVMTTSSLMVGEAQADIRKSDIERALARAAHPSRQLIARLAQAGSTLEDFRANLRAAAAALEQTAPDPDRMTHDHAA